MNEIKIRYVHPEELINLTEYAKNYFLDLRSKDIINYDDTNGVKIKVLKEDEVTNKLLDNMINLLSELQKDYEKTIKFL